VTGLSVRRATPADCDAILDIATRAWHDTYDDIVRTATIERALEEWYDPDSVRSAITGDARDYLVAEEEAVVGYLSGEQVDDGRGIIGAIYADPDRRGEGVGTALLDRFESICRDRGCSAIELRALADNDIGGSFYRSRGFEAVETDGTELFGEPVSETVFRRQIE